MLTAGSLFSGIGGFDAGFEQAGLGIAWQCEIEPFARRVLARHFPGVPCVEDVRDVQQGAVDVICAGFPCQDVSVAGKRAGLAGSRTGLFFEVIRVLDLLKPSWVVLENVPGLLSSANGADFATVLSELENVGYVGCWRTLDSRWFGVAQRRRRMFFVGHRGDGARAKSVLFESSGGDWDSPARAEAGTDVAACLRGRSHGVGVNMPGRGGEDDVNLVCGPLGGGNDGIGRRTEDDPNLVYQCHGNNVGPMGALRSGDGGLTSGVPFIAASSGERARALTSSMHKRHDEDTDTLIVAATLNSGGNAGGFRTEPGEHLLIANTLRASDGHHGHSSPRGDGCDNLVIEQTYQPETVGVRRLTPLECERLQAFSDGWTCLCGVEPYRTANCKCADSPRYRALGNAVTVSVARWIGSRMLEAEGVALRATPTEEPA